MVEQRARARSLPPSRSATSVDDVKRAVARNERAAEQGRKPRRIDTALASLAPAGLVPLE